MDIWWLFLIGLRLLWSSYGQLGYIHPDEFFQSTEVIAGDILHIETDRTWEFKQEHQLRSMVFPYMMYGLPLMLVKYISDVSGIVSISPHLLLVLPRIIFTCLTVATELMVFKIAKNIGSSNPGVCRLLFASSYISHTYLTRPFSNSIETFLFVALLCVTLSPVYPSSQSSRSKKQARKKTQSKKSSCVYSDIALSLILTLGFWNRPTFLCFAFLPCLHWITQKPSFYAMFQTSLTCVASALAFAVVCVICDSLYYGTFWVAYEHFMSLQSVEAVKLLTFTPINFLLYNTKTENLGEHGIHFRGQHLFVNTLLLFNVLALLALIDFGKFLFHAISMSLSLEKLRSHVMIWIYFIPIFVLSIFPHQEPRFLLPLLAPLCVLYHAVLFKRKMLLIMWIVVNLVCCIFYGVLHQGGVTSSLVHLSDSIVRNNPNRTDIVYHNTYMPPKQLLKLEKSHDVALHDLKGANYQHLLSSLRKIPPHSQVYYVAPASTFQEICPLERDGFSFHLIKKFFPHLSTEDLPSIKVILCQNHSDVINCSEKCSVYSFINRLTSLFSLNLYEVKFPNDAT